MSRKLLISLTATSLLSLLSFGCEQEHDIDESWCLAAPTCAPDEVEVDSCEEGDTTCSPNSICNQTIYCQEIPTSCAAIPICPEGSVELTQCPPNPAGGICAECADGSCFEVTECDASITCKDETPDPVCVPPICPPNRIPVEACADNGSDCITIPGCGDTSIGCLLDETCHETPQCPADHTVVNDRCENDGPDCVAPGRLCDGTEYHCKPATSECLAVPTCPAGATEITQCEAGSLGVCEPCEDGTCYTVSVCSTTLICKNNDPACAPQDAAGEGLCDAYFGVAFNGMSCVSLSGCNCIGDDCDATYADMEACQAARSACFAD